MPPTGFAKRNDGQRWIARERLVVIQRILSIGVQCQVISRILNEEFSKNIYSHIFLFIIHW